MSGLRGKRSDRLIRALGEHERILVVMHDNPDPDAIAAGWAVRVLIRKLLGRTARIVGGGDIVRAENRHMVTLLRPPIELVDALEPGEAAAAILIDCSATAENHLLAKADVRPVAVIDHHSSNRERGQRMPFRDVRRSAAAAASIAASYLREQDITPGPRLATALAYAIRTETQGAQISHSRLDRSILRWLADHVNPEWIAEIENAPLAKGYFGDLARALVNTTVHGDAAFCLLPEASGAETVGEVADLLIRYEAAHHVLCAARVGGDLVVSVRTGRGGRDAAALVRRSLEGLGGGGGGHEHRAGGKVPAEQIAGRGVASLRDELRARWLEACGADPGHGVPLVRRPLTRRDDRSPPD